MSALILSVKRTLRSPARINVIMFLLFVIFALGLLLLYNTPTFSVSYNGARVSVISPVETQLCAGDTVHFPITVTIEDHEIPGQLQIAEAWCKAGVSGSCIGVVPPRPNLPLLEEKHINSTSSRVVPEALTAGTWHLWHSATNSRGSVSGYIVAPVYIVDCASP